MVFTKHQAQRLAFIEKWVEELAREKHLTEILLEQRLPQVIVLEAEPAPMPGGLEHRMPWTQPVPSSLLSEHTRKLVSEHPGMLFHCGVPSWQVGLTLETSRLVFVPHALYSVYEQECLKSVGWSEQLASEYEDSISVEDEETGEVETQDWPNPVRRQGVWKARQVAHWTGESETPELKYAVWANGAWG